MGRMDTIAMYDELEALQLELSCLDVTEWEYDFILDVGQNRSITPKQKAIIAYLYHKYIIGFEDEDDGYRH